MPPIAEDRRKSFRNMRLVARSWTIDCVQFLHHHDPAAHPDCALKRTRMPTKTLRAHGAGAGHSSAVRARRAKRPKPLSASEIHERVLNAILEHRLRPGMQLVEERLAAVFGVSRT